MSVDRLIARLSAVFGEPRTEDPGLFVSEIAAALVSYSSDVLEITGDRVRNECRYWPRPAEIRAIADAVAYDLSEPQRRAEREQHAREQAEMYRRDCERRAAPERVAALMAEFRRTMSAMDVAERERECNRRSARPAVTREAMAARMVRSARRRP